MSKVVLRKYGEAATFNFDLFNIDGVDFNVSAVHASGDTKLMKDEGAEVNTTNGFVDEGQGFSIVLTATEMEHARGRVYIVGQGTKEWLDTGIIIETYGHASAQHPYFGEGVWDRQLTGATHNVAASSGRRLRAIGDVVSGSVDDVSATVNSFITDLTGTHPDHYADQTLLFTSGNLAGLSRQILSYNESTFEVTVEEDLPEAPANTDTFDINPVHIHPVSQIVNSVWDRVLTNETHNITKSAGKRMRGIEEYQGYEGGKIYINTDGGGEAGSDPYVNGVLDKPVNNLADALLLSASVGINCFEVSSGSSLIFISGQDGKCYVGNNWTLALGEQSINGTFIEGASISGIATATITTPKLRDCTINGTTLPPGHYHSCGFTSTILAGASGDYFFTDCESDIAGGGFPSFDFGAAVGDVNANFREFRGELELKNMEQAGTDKASIDGNGRVSINANCIGGTISIQGHQDVIGRAAFITAGGTVNDVSRFALDQLVTHVIGADGDTLESLSGQIDVIQVDGINVISALDGTVQAKYAADGGTVEVVRGDTVNIPYDLTVDMTGKKLYVAAKKKAGAPTYMIAVTEITSSITDAAEGQGLIPLTSADLAIPPQIYDAELEMRDDDGTSNPITVLKFKLKVVEQVII